jgi:hypothetical protein
MNRQQSSDNIDHSRHLVVISDEDGVYNAFFHIKDILTKEHNAYLSFIYAIKANSSDTLFELELLFLEKRYASSFIVYKTCMGDDVPNINTQLLEALINSNTSEEMNFILYGDHEFVAKMTESIHFLEIKSCEYKIINNKDYEN